MHLLVHAILLSFIAYISAISPTLVKKISVPHAAFLRLQPTGDTFALQVSQFNPFDFFDYDPISVLPDIGSQLSKPETNLFHLNTSISGFNWPNEIQYAPVELGFSEFGGIIVPSGFLVPLRTHGSLYYFPFLDKSQTQYGNPIDLMPDENHDWFYHRVQYADMDGDNDLEIVTCRGYKPVFGSHEQQVVVLTRDGGKWKPKIVATDGCDFFFRIIDRAGKKYILAADYFRKGLNLLEAEHGNWLQDKVVKYPVDATMGAGFGVELMTINNTEYALVTNHQGSSDSPTGSVYLYKVPDEVTDVCSWKRYVLVSGIPVRQSGVQQASPGNAVFFYAKKGDEKTNKPMIGLSGDGSQHAYILEPVEPSLASESFKYKVSWNQTVDCTVGAVAFGDVNNDGNTEMFVAAYDNGFVYAYELRQ
jgi:hypothetical protein